MNVHLTKIYTRTGDAGDTRLSDNSKVHKTDPRLTAYADVDETNSVLGVVLATATFDTGVYEALRAVQNDLFDVGADLSTPVVESPPHPPLRVTQNYVDRLESLCDEYNAQLGKLDSFILPGGTPGGALLHQARCVARRAERSAWALMEHDAERTHELPAKYLNRLSDLLFILARLANPEGDVLWRPAGNA
ncbi:cob(I)alamin adenosyltransferase [Saccharopolyspora lacisalsi]|uniref:Corrinoid adenosyltransferase n=1 Tax=Halosaccharopolyspora lacisalsi TaxID=1000566 RepID=A0A839E1A3_9PSEU|nr:cob(I)yrinic acid a,c-diamide adenosyltransferase [Halosaccharopolyspora lacisalsi]MBA8825201.1 cob(I)alamin adenosyltransferase [Halosaccharopolyspora lacisalsi]